MARYRYVLQLDPSLARVHARLGQILLLELGEIDTAEAALRRACELDPELVESRQHLGVLLLDSGRPEPAAKWLGEAARLAPSQPIVARTYAEALTLLPGKRSAAMAAWHHYLDVSRDHPEEEPARGQARVALRQLEVRKD